MATPFPTDDPYLKKGFEPIRFECDYADLMIDGEIPYELNGCLYRIGPNPQFAPRGRYNPLLGDGMIHAFDVREGKVSYRNRWVTTDQWKLERSAGRALFSTSGNPKDSDSQVAELMTNGIANTNLVWHAGRLLALEEGHAPIEVDAVSLETLDVWNFKGKLPGNSTAHPKIDPETGEMLFFANFPSRDFSGAIEIYVADRDGALVQSRRIQGPFPCLIHDFAITEDYLVFFACPLTVSIERARSGSPAIAWEPDKEARIGVLPRRSESTDVTWISLPACMVWHAVNAFNDDQSIFVDVCSQEAAAFPTINGKLAEPDQFRQFLTRWQLEVKGGQAVHTKRLSEEICEYPKIDDRRSGRTYRYCYVACKGGPGTGDLFHRGIGRFDHASGQMDTYHAGDACAVSEPIFVPRSDGAAENEGFLLCVIFDEQKNASRLAVFDASDVSDGPIARVLLDHRVPMGFHGTWINRSG